MDPKLQKLYDFTEYNNSHGVYRSEFFGIVGPALREHADKSIPMRRALALEKLLDESVLVVQPYEMLLGTIAGTYPKVEMPPYEERKEEGRKVVLDYIEKKKRDGENYDKSGRHTLYSRIHYHGNIEYAQMQKMIKDLWQDMKEDGLVSEMEIGRELERHFNWNFGEDNKTINALPWQAINHNDLNPPRFLALGLGGIREQIAACAATAGEDKKEFYETQRITIEAVIRYFKRYADAARKEALKDTIDQERRSELMEMAAIVEKVSEDKPQTFREAIQLVWLMYTISNIQATAGSCASYARFDQYMYPFYKKDMEEGRISEDEALLYIGNLFCKVNEPKMRTVVSMCVGGQTPGGKDGANEVTKLCLRATQTLRQPFPNLSVRFFNGSPEWLHDMVVDTIKLGIGNPMLLNDEVYVPNLVRQGYALEDARLYYNMGCVETMLMGRIPTWSGIGACNFPAILNQVLTNGGFGENDDGGEKSVRARNGNGALQRGKADPIATGTLEELDSFEKFMAAFKAQLTNNLSTLKANSDLIDQVQSTKWCDPFGSLVLEGCIEKGLDMYRGGCMYGPQKPVGASGVATGADSLAAIKKFVYDEKRLTLREFKTILDADFIGYDNIRMLCENNTPCYGNDDKAVDDIARTIFGWYADTVHAVGKDIWGAPCTSIFSYTGHVITGEVTGAMPNGRRAGTPISDSMGSTQGKDMGGPTRLMNSAINMDNSRITGAYVLNMKLSPAVVRGDAGTANLKALVKAYLNNGGIQLQVNFVDSQTLIAAKQEPDKYRNLIVRVAGYCEYFNNLDDKLQNEIISRTMHEMG